jgi:hypothetical protein
MTPAAVNPEPTETLDSLTLTRKEGWQAFVDHQKGDAPEVLTRRQIDALGEKARAEYDQSRRRWHANLGPFETPQWKELHEDLWDIVDSNMQTGDKTKGGVALDAFPGLGKTTTVLDFGAKFQRREIRLKGRYTAAGHERLPVCRVGLTGNTGMLDFNRAMLSFFAHPGMTRGSAAQFAERALDSMVKCKTRLLIIDELHFLQWRNSQGVAISNHFKHIANDFPVTLIFIGVGLEARGLFSEGTSYEDAVIAQTGRRTTRLEMKAFTIKNDRGRSAWRNLLLAIEQQVVLADKKQGMLADELSDYLFARSTGHIGSLMTLINRGCQRAVRTGVEQLNKELLDRVKNDAASEMARKELEPAFEARRLTTRPKRRAS